MNTEALTATVEDTPVVTQSNNHGNTKQRPIFNKTINNVFLKSVYFLKSKLSKVVIFRFFLDTGRGLGVFIKTKNSYAYFNREKFNTLMAHASSITIGFYQDSSYLGKLVVLLSLIKTGKAN